MSPSRRIVLNIVATYGRSLYALIVGLVTARWTLQALGSVDFGLYGVIGGMMSFIGFVNAISSVAISRFYAFSIGQAKIKEKTFSSREECCRWFNVAVTIHTIIPIVLMLIGYPLGLWAIEHWLTIPEGRILDCIWLFRFACISCFIGMVNVPFNAMYGAKQYIAELTVYGFASTTTMFFVLLYMVKHPRVWLVQYGIWTCAISIIPMIIICVRAIVVFPECRIRFEYMFSFQRIKRLGGFAGWYAFGMFGNLLRYQGLTILVNKCLGPTMNASLSVANSVAAHSKNLTAALVGAFSPALTTACGEKKMLVVEMFMYKICKFGSVLILLFAIPLSLEIHKIMQVWLITPPRFAGELAVLIMMSLVLESVTTGHWIAMSAYGDIRAYQLWVGFCFVLTLPIAYSLVKMGFGVLSVGYSLCITLVAAIIIRVTMVYRVLLFRPMIWMKEVLFPVLLVAVVSGFSGFFVTVVMEESLLRVLITTIVVEIILLSLTWLYVLRTEERMLVVTKLKKLYEYI